MNDARTRYLQDTVATATPALLLTLLYDRLLLDLDQGAAALRAGDRPAGTTHLTHAQDVVSELLASLDQDAWAAAPGLASVYAYLLGELATAVTRGDAERAAACREVVAPLADAWHEAARASATGPAHHAGTTGDAAPGGLLGVG